MILHVVFIAIMVRIYTLPLFVVRPMYLTMRAFKKALNDVILSRLVCQKKSEESVSDFVLENAVIVPRVLLNSPCFTVVPSMP